MLENSAKIVKKIWHKFDAFSSGWSNVYLDNQELLN